MKGKFLFAALCVLGSSVALAQANDASVSTLTVYDTALANGWQDWSWAKTTPSVELGGSTRRPMKVEAGPWGALALHHASIDTTPYKSFSMLLNGMGKGQRLRIDLIAGGKTLTPEGHTVTLASEGWTKIELPLETLGAAKTQVDQIQVQNATGEAASPFYVTEVKFN